MDNEIQKLALTGFFIGLILLEGCSQQIPLNRSFYAKYVSSSGGWEESKNITITVSEGNIEYKETDPATGKVIKSFTQKLSEAELKELKENIIEQNDFFELPKELSNYRCADASTERIDVILEDEMHVSGGYCVQDASFRDIARKLNEYKNKYQNED